MFDDVWYDALGAETRDVIAVLGLESFGHWSLVKKYEALVLNLERLV